MNKQKSVKKYSPLCYFFKLLKWIKEILSDCCDCGCGSGSGSDSGNSTSKRTIRLVRTKCEVIGRGLHRSGWPYAFSCLTSIESDDGILFDDFVEQTFCYSDKPQVYAEPWAGIFHHPPYPPAFSNTRESLSNLFEENKAFIESLKNLKMAFALTEWTGNFLRKRLNCPVVVVKHPAQIPQLKWSPDSYTNNTDKQMMQIGHYLRNTKVLYQFPAIPNISKKKPAFNKAWIKAWDFCVENYWATTKFRKDLDLNIETYPFLTAYQYDYILQSNLAIMEFFDVSAANGIIDCIARNTPVFTNKHPATIEYLGEDYPLFFENPLEIPDLMDKVYEASEYLKKMDKSWMSGERFASQISQEIGRIKL